MTREILLPDGAATSALGARLAGLLRPGDLITLAGPVGAGKSHLARAAIQSLLSAEGRHEEVPSPSFTLVQGYETRLGEVLHADLYRLGDPRDLDDIGLSDALGHAICLVEWPELLALPPAFPRLEITLSAAPLAVTGEEGRRARLHGIGARWQGVPAALAAGYAPAPATTEAAPIEDGPSGPMAAGVAPTGAADG